METRLIVLASVVACAQAMIGSCDKTTYPVWMSNFHPEVLLTPLEVMSFDLTHSGDMIAGGKTPHPETSTDVGFIRHIAAGDGGDYFANLYYMTPSDIAYIGEVRFQHVPKSEFDASGTTPSSILAILEWFRYDQFVEDK